MYAFCIEYKKQTYLNVTECFGCFFSKKKQNLDVFMLNVYNFKSEEEEMAFN